MFLCWRVNVTADKHVSLVCLIRGSSLGVHCVPTVCNRVEHAIVVGGLVILQCDEAVVRVLSLTYTSSGVGLSIVEVPQGAVLRVRLFDFFFCVMMSVEAQIDVIIFRVVGETQHKLTLDI